ncbi:hypothetical protein C1Y08_29985, partial [Pseudomonas sp. FW306-02-F02-AA]|uniref:Ig-like domain-containing protein n=1 Tax=Pseudomonas sp. FW306-02-F02-AA TaxID=2070652 RepID=UPI000CB6E873
MALDRESKATFIPSVYLCHGGVHDFSITAEKDSPWTNHGVSLNGESGKPLTLTAEPKIGTDQPFEESGARWKINCPAKGADTPVETFQLWVQTEYTSPAYKIPVSLGHHRVVIEVVLSPIRLSVVGQEVKAIIQVESYYTQEALGDVKVKWRVGNTVVDEVVTTANGQSSFTFTPETVGEHTITAEVESLYYGPDVPVEQSFDFEVLENSPWEQATLSMNGTPVDLSKQDLVIFRGQENDLTLEFAQLTGYGFTLQLVESDAGLNVEANPPFELEQPMPPTGQLWTLTPGKDKSGFCKLRISSPAVSVDWEIVCRVFSTDLGDEAEIEIGGMVVPVGGNTFFR